jgi:serine/threonine protein kinase
MVHSVPTDPDFLALQAALAGEYSIERELGRGRMGIVYLARGVTLDRPVAIKLLRAPVGARPPRSRPPSARRIEGTIDRAVAGAADGRREVAGLVRSPTA